MPQLQWGLLKEVSLNCQLPLWKQWKVPHGSRRFLIPKCPVSCSVSAQHLLSLPTSCLLNLKRPLRAKKKGQHEEGSCFKWLTQHDPVRRISHLKVASDLVSKQPFPRNYFRGDKLNHLYLSSAVNQAKLHTLCTLSTKRWRNTLSSWVLCSCAALQGKEVNAPAGFLISRSGCTPRAASLCHTRCYTLKYFVDPWVSSGRRSSTVSWEELCANLMVLVLDLVKFILS